MSRFARNRFAPFLVVGLTLLAFAGCKGATPIKTLLDDPGQYEVKTVRVQGTVKSNISVLNYGAYRLDDGTGTITVITQTGGAPREGARVGVEGDFRSAFTIGTESVAAIMEHKRKSL